MLITLGEDWPLIFSWYENPYRKKSVTLPEDKATRRSINAIFRAVDGRELTKKKKKHSAVCGSMKSWG